MLSEVTKQRKTSNEDLGQGDCPSQRVLARLSGSGASNRSSRGAENNPFRQMSPQLSSQGDNFENGGEDDDEFQMMVCCDSPDCQDEVKNQFKMQHLSEIDEEENRERVEKKADLLAFTF